MKWKNRSLIAIVMVSLAATPFSCATTLGTSLRDAAIDGAAGYVEGATAELLNRWLPLQGE